jgi:glucosamine-phosphate N-acetyltransferase
MDRGAPLEDDANLVLRPLEKGDFSKGYLALLSQLTTVDTAMDVKALEERFDELFPSSRCPVLPSGLFTRGKRRHGKKAPPSYSIAVIEDTSKKTIVATATLFVELKFIRGCAACGHIEDVVVDGGYRGKQLGRRVIERCMDDAKSYGCYKVILDCSEENKPFYEKCGLEKKEIQMVRYL